MRAMRAERSRLTFGAGIKGRYQTDDASEEQKVSQLARQRLKVGRTSVFGTLIVSVIRRIEE